MKNTYIGIILILSSLNLFAQNQEKIYFIQKAAKILRNGKVITNTTQLQSLAKKNKSEIFDYLIASDQFYFTILKFNLSFLQSDISGNFSFNNSNIIEEYKEDGSLRFNELAITQSQAFRSVMNLKQNGHYLELLGFETPNVMGPRREYFRNPENKEIQYPTPAQRQQVLDHVVSKLQDFISWIKEQKGALTRKQFCIKSESYKDLFPVYFNLWTSAKSVGAITNEWFPLWDLYESKMFLYCSSSIDEKFYDPLADTQGILEFIQSVKNNNSSLNPSSYVIKKIDDFKFRPKPIRRNRVRKLTTFFEMIENSSTNFSRKRAAYILSTYFCDNLVPIAFVDPKNNHPGDKHASDKACMACHYKLDPMAGFFKDHGIYGLEFNKMKNIMFSDNATMSNIEYQKNWLAPISSKRKWDIGYIRSTKDQSLNEYGENLDDLFKIIQNAPEVKACIVKKMFKYFLGDKISVDSEFEKGITDSFIQEAKNNSSHAFKNTLKKIILSKSFVQTEIEKGKCYDFKSGSNTKNRPPCEINTILKNNCISCHSTSDIYPFLDLSKYQKNSFGEFNFIHKTKDGKDLTRSKTLDKIKLRISTNDPNFKMPKNDQYFSSKDRTKLFLWLQGEQKR